MEILYKQISIKLKLLVIISGLFFIAIIGYIDYRTTYEISLALFYLVPIMLTGWFLGMFEGICYSIICLTMIILLDYLSADKSRSIKIYLWNDFGIFGFYIIISIILSKLKKVIIAERELSLTDPLTGIANSRAFNNAAANEIARSQRYGHPLTVAFIDCDNFKKVNDVSGHSAGDRLLKLVATTIFNNIRQIDTVARIGGDEFVILLPETDMEISRGPFVNLQNKLSEIMKENNWPVTFSIGVATFVKLPKSVNELLKESDNLMYYVKKHGKNSIKARIFR
jgi:diguanylate cyclase (GGDEF)-like protein